MIRVVLVDDDYLVTESLQMILEASGEIEVVACGHSADDAETLYLNYLPDILLTDIRMGDGTGIDAATKILAKHSEALILLLTTFSDEDYINDVLSIGIKGYLIKQNLASIIPAIKTVYNGQSVFGTEIVGKLSELIQKQPSTNTNDYHLSSREETILLEIADGKNNKEIAEKLFLSEGTVRNYISQLLEKLQVRDRTQLAIFYYKFFDKKNTHLSQDG